MDGGGVSAQKKTFSFTADLDEGVDPESFLSL